MPIRTSAVRSVLERLGLSDRKKRKGVRPAKQRAFSLEPLERRELLSVCTWSGQGTDNKWSTAANWSGNAAPGAGDQLVFVGTTQTSTQNDLAAGTSFQSIEFQGSGFSLSGNSATVTGNITVDSGVTGSEQIALNVGLGGTVDVETSGDALAISGVISGSGSLTKTGSGTLILTGVNTYSGSTNVDGGTLELAGPVNVSALSAGATVNINDGGTLLADTRNCFGAGSSQPPIVINSGGCMTTADGVVVTVNSLTLAGGTLSSSQIPCPGWGSWYMIGPVHATADSTIDAVQMYLAGATFTVDSGVTLDVPGSFTMEASA